jgi:hypothetical protein
MNEDNPDEYVWVDSNGGPTLLIEETFVKSWEGSEIPSNGRVVEAEFRWGLDVATDYDRACDIEDWLGVLDVGEGNALVFSGFPTISTWVPLIEREEGIIVRWIAADNEAQIIEKAKSLIKDKSDDYIEFEVGNAELILMPAVESWKDNQFTRLKISLASGIYKVSTLYHESEHVFVACHHFRK